MLPHGIRQKRFAIHGTWLGVLPAVVVTATLIAGPMVTAASQDSRVVYICPMDAGVRQPGPAKCPICGMALVPSTPDEFLEYDLRVAAKQGIAAGRRLTLAFSVYHPRTGERISDFVEVHEKLFHLFVVSHDLEYFAHVHPEPQRDGSFRLSTTLPKAGFYELIADFFPRGGTPQMIQRSLVTAGYTQALRSARLQPDASWVQTRDGLRIEMLPRALVARKPTLLSIHVSDARVGRPVTDLEPYLGASGHMLIVSDDLSDSVHVHPAPETKAEAGELVFEARFPRPVDYRMWVQFQLHGKVVTVPFTVRVAEIGAQFREPE